MANPQHATLTAGTVTTITLDDPARRVEIINVDGAAAVYVTVDGSTPAVAAAGCWVLPGSINRMVLGPATGGGIKIVKLISSGTPAVSVGAIG